MKNSTQALFDARGYCGPDRIVDREKQELDASTPISDLMRVRTVRFQSWEDLSGLEAAWTALLNRSRTCSVFQTFAWHACWWKAFGGPHELFVVLGYAGLDLAGIAPMMITRDKGPLGQVRDHVRFIGSSNNASDYCDFITDPAVPQVLHALLEEMKVSANGFHRIDLSHFPSHSPNKAGILEYFAGHDPVITVEFQADAPVRMLGDGEADRKAANKSSLKRHTRFFEKSGDLRFRQCASEDEILGYLDIFFELHKARWAPTGSPSQFLDPDQQVFYRELVGQAFRHGWLRFDVVLFDGAPLAFHFGFEYQRRFIWYKSAFDVRFASRSPGEVLLRFLLEDAIGKGLEEFDFTVGSESFKYRFANLTRTNDRIIVFRSAGDYWTHRGISRGKAMLKKLLRRDAASKSKGNAESA
jgi:CelD/BcsL family acetyltransferase involved in cellulose biosynthesis